MRTFVSVRTSKFFFNHYDKGSKVLNPYIGTSFEVSVKKGHLTLLGMLQSLLFKMNFKNKVLSKWNVTESM